MPVQDLRALIGPASTMRNSRSLVQSQALIAAAAAPFAALVLPCVMAPLPDNLAAPARRVR
ncbi:hypothetical protein CAL14_03240 [Bordetella genomosp. 9]|nr:hypothetical protein CAL14_03240 [Bordetella genomosp. 9]